MSTELTEVDVDEGDTDLGRVRVETEDATGQERAYEVGLSADAIDGEHILSGRRVDADAPDGPAGGGPSEAAWDAAADHFREQGHEVFGR